MAFDHVSGKFGPRIEHDQQQRIGPDTAPAMGTSGGERMEWGGRAGTDRGCGGVGGRAHENGPSVDRSSCRAAMGADSITSLDGSGFESWVLCDARLDRHLCSGNSSSYGLGGGPDRRGRARGDSFGGDGVRVRFRETEMLD